MEVASLAFYISKSPKKELGEISFCCVSPKTARMRQQRGRDFCRGWLPLSLCFSYDSPFFKTKQQPLQRKGTERVHLGVVWLRTSYSTAIYKG